MSSPRAAPSRRSGSAAAGTLGLGLLSLPDDLLERCLAPLSQEERFCCAALVCKRLQQAALAPSLLRTVSVSVAGPSLVRRLIALLELLTAHAAHVRSLTLEVADVGAADEEAAALLAGCLSACAAAGRLARLAVSSAASLGSTAWLPALTSLRQLRLATSSNRARLRLPVGISCLTALEDCDLASKRLRLGAALLPCSLTRLRLDDVFSRQAPPPESLAHQVSRLHRLVVLDLDQVDVERLGDKAALAAAIARLPALRTLCLPDWLPGLPALPRLECLSLGIVGGTKAWPTNTLGAFEAALGGMPHLTALSFYSEDMSRLPPTLAGLSRLRRAALNTINCELQDCSLPPGPWLASLRWLGLCWDVLGERQALEALRSAAQLQYLCCMQDPPYRRRPDAQEHWRAFFEFAATHPPLRCLGIEGGYERPVSSELLDSVVHLACVRPGLRLRRPTAGHPFAFQQEVLTCAELPLDSGTGFSGYPVPYLLTLQGA